MRLLARIGCFVSGHSWQHVHVTSTGIRITVDPMSGLSSAMALMLHGAPQARVCYYCGKEEGRWPEG